MDIFHSNFYEKLGLIADDISECDYITLDTEFSGLNLTDWDWATEVDSVETHYQKIKFTITRMHAF